MSGTRGQGARRRRQARRAEQRKQAMRRTSLTAAASGSKGLPLGPRGAKWDSSAAESAVRSWAGAADGPNAKYASAFMVKQNDGSKFGDYKLQFAQPADGGLQANWGAITAIAGVLSGARGGADISDAEKASAKAKVESYYAKARTKYQDDQIKVPWASEASAVESVVYALLGEDADEAEIAVTRFMVEQEFAQGQVVWDEEDGVMDLMDDLSCALNPGMGDMPAPARWCVLDVAVKADKALLCDCQEHEYWLAPFTIGDDREPVLSPQAEWTAIEEAWVADDDKYDSAIGFAMARWEEYEDAQQVACENCGHAFSSHEGTDGACGNDGCACMSYAPVTSADNDFTATFVPNTMSITTGQETGTSSSVQKFTVTTNTANGTFDGDTITITPPADPTAGEVEWSAVLAPEGKLTSDGRAFAPGAITWPRLDDGPLSLMAMTETSEGGHIGAKLAGKIDRIWRDEASGLIRAKGTFDTSEYGQEISRMVADQMLRGVSVDLAIHKAEAGPRSAWFDADGNWDPKPDGEQADTSTVPLLDRLYNPDDPDIAVVFEAEIGMTTVCPFPAFAEAKIALGDSLVAGASASPELWTVTGQAGFTLVALTAATEAPAETVDDGSPCQECGEQGEALTASAAGLVVDAPPAGWFEDPQLGVPTPLTVTDDGRVYGHVCSWASCHIGFPGKCVQPPHSQTGYAYFHLGEVQTDDGARIAVGSITMDTGHAATGIGRAETVKHYDHTGTVVAHVRAGEDEHGVWVAGALAPDVDADKARLFMGGKPSGDWRNVDGNLELVAVLTVNVPGFPVPRTRTAYTNGEVTALVAAGIVIEESEISEDDREKFRALLAQDEFKTIAEA